MLKAYRPKTFAIASLEDDREESYYSTLESLIKVYVPLSHVDRKELFH